MIFQMTLVVLKVQLGIGTANAASGIIDLRTKSPITVNAPIKNLGEGKILLAALGKEAADDITINSTITGDDLEVYAGDSIILNPTANIVIVDPVTNQKGNAEFFFGTDISTTSPDDKIIKLEGASGANIFIKENAVLNTLVDVSSSVTTQYSFDGVSSRLINATQGNRHDNFSDPNLETSNLWSSVDYGNVIISNEYSVEEDEEETKISISKIKDQLKSRTT